MVEMTAKEKMVVERIVNHDRSGSRRIAGVCLALASTLVVGLLAIAAAKAPSDRLWDALAVGGMILTFIAVVWVMTSQRMVLEAVIRKISQEQGCR